MNFRKSPANDEEGFGFDEPEYFESTCGIAIGHGSDDESCAEGAGEEETEMTSNFAGEKGNAEVEESGGGEKPETQLGMKGLVMEKGQVADGVQEEGNGEEEFVRVFGIVAKEMRDEIDEPVSGEQGDALIEIRKKLITAGARVDLVKPQPVDDVSGGDSERLDGVPAAHAKDDDERGGEERGSDKRSQWNCTDANGGESEQVSEARGDFAVVDEGMRDHCGGDQEKQDEAERGVRHEADGGNIVQSVGGEIGERPAAAEDSASRDAIALFALTNHSDDEHHGGENVPESDFPHRAEIMHGVIQKERDTDDECGRADLVQPVGTEPLFHVRPTASGRFFGGRCMRPAFAKTNGGCDG